MVITMAYPNRIYGWVPWGFVILIVYKIHDIFTH